MKLAPETLWVCPVYRSVQVCVVAPVPGPMSPPTSLESIPHFSVWLVNGVTQALAVAATLAVKSPALLVIVSDVATGEALLAANVPLVQGVA